MQACKRNVLDKYEWEEKLANLLAFLRGSIADKVIEAQRKSLDEGNVLILNGFPEELMD